MDPKQAAASQLANIERRTGRRIDELVALLRATGLQKHGELREHLKQCLGMGHGDANGVVHVVLNGGAATGAANPPGGPAAGVDADADSLDTLYTGKKAALRPIHVAFMRAIAGFGPFEVAPKKTYVSLRRRRQFAMIGPATQTRVDVGLNDKTLPGTMRLKAKPAGGMCSHQVALTAVEQVDAELIGWVRRAYDAAG